VLQRHILTLALLLTGCSAFASNASAVVGGTDVPAGQRGYVAYISIDGLFACTGTLVSPTFVVTAGHCSTTTAGTPLNVPIGKLGQEIEVTLGTVRRDDPMGEKPGVKRVIVHPEYVFTNNGGSSADVALLELTTPSVQTPVPIVGKGEEALFAPGVLAQIAGFGRTAEEGNAGNPPEIMQQAEVPIVSDEVAAAAYPDSFENETQIGAGFPQGGVDTCQGDSGGPLIVRAPDGTLRLAGDTSYGDGCARAGKPGIYGRLGGQNLRGFVAANAPQAIAPDATGSSVPSQPAQRPSQQQGPSQPAPAPAQSGQPGQSRPSGSGSTKKKRSTPCRKRHRGSARHRRTAKHQREVKQCLKRQRAQRRARSRPR